MFCAAVLGCGDGGGGSGGGGSGGTGGGGSGGTGGGGGTGGNGVVDMAQPQDLANAFMCGSTYCPPNQKCCVNGMTPTCATSCPGDGGFVAECKGPENCGGNPCCITIGSGFMIQDVVCTTSPSACPPMVNVQTQSGMDRACKVDTDCTAGVSMPSLPDCCTNTMTAQKVCFNKSYTQFVQGWTCP
ncbi:MAG: hypothetical protein JWN44_1126 [Myxococcales bacterium]|nr:hypothetical protein [Myxococcales bacterium]